MWSGSAMLSSTAVPARRWARVPSSCVQPIAASIGTFATWMPCGISSLAMLWASPALAWHAMAKAPLKGKPFSAALALVKMIVPLAPLAFGLFSRIRRAACRPTRNALNAELRIVSNAMVGSASMIPLRKMPGTRPSMLCTTSVGAPSSPATLWNRNSTEVGSLASHAYRRTPWVFSRACRTGLSAFRAAMATRMPSLANSLAQLELMPGPPPTMSATSCRTVDVSISVMDRIPLLDPAVQAPHAGPREHQVEEDDTEQDRRIGTIERPVGHRYLGRCGQGGDAGVESDGDQDAAYHFDHSDTRVQPVRHAGLRGMEERGQPLNNE